MKISLFLTAQKTLIFPLLLSISGSIFAQDEQDPYESFNRRVFAFNEFLDRYLVKPVAKGYDWITPKPVDDSVTRFFSNLGDLGVGLNNALQGKFSEAGSDVVRFTLNTTLGVAGIFDVATPMGLLKHEEDFGQTLAIWGANQGPYLVLPLLGPATARSAFGKIPDYFTHPVTYIDDETVRYGLTGLELIDKRSDLMEYEDSVSGDKYLFIRDVYLQRREFLVNDGVVEEDPFTADDFEDDY